MSSLRRRDLLATSAIALFAMPQAASAISIKGALPWTPGPADPPEKVIPGPWQYFTPDKAAVEAPVNRLIPSDPETPGGKDAGCAVFIGRQLAGAYGRFEDHYMQAPFRPGTKEPGDQSPLAPAQYYRIALADLDRHCRNAFGNTIFASLSDDRKDQLIKGMEDGSLKLEHVDGKFFFDALLIDTQGGFFTDPIHGGNKDMAS